MASWIHCCLLIMALALAPICAAAADRPGWTKVIGGHGGAEFEGACGRDGYLVGIAWNGGKDINAIKPICQRFESGRATGEQIWKPRWGQLPSEEEGASFAADQSLVCPTDTAVQKLGVGVSNANMVHTFSFACRNPNAHDYTYTNMTGPTQGATRDVDMADCGGGAIAVGVVGRYGTMIDALGLLCRAIAAPAPPPAGPPEKPIKSSHGAPDPNAPPANPVGSWDMHNGKGEHYVLQLSRNGGDVSGTIRDDQGAVSAVTGRIFAGGMLNLHYSLPGRSGEEVVFIKGDTLSGADKASGTPWTGARLAGNAAAAGARATAINDVDMYSDPDGNSTNLGIWRKGSQATPLQSQDGWCKLKGIANGQDAWAWGELVSGCAP